MPGITLANSQFCQAKQARHRSNLTVIPFETAIRLQELIVQAAEAPETTPAALAQLARAWSELEHRKRVIKMKPDPKPIDVTPRNRKSQRKAAAFVELPQAPEPPPKT